jgi:hypothetical protein
VYNSYQDERPERIQNAKEPNGHAINNWKMQIVVA